MLFKERQKRVIRGKINLRYIIRRMLLFFAEEPGVGLVYKCGLKRSYEILESKERYLTQQAP